MKSQSWYNPEQCADDFATQNACYENTVIFFLSKKFLT